MRTAYGNRRYVQRTTAPASDGAAARGRVGHRTSGSPGGLAIARLPDLPLRISQRAGNDEMGRYPNFCPESSAGGAVNEP